MKIALTAVCFTLVLLIFAGALSVLVAQAPSQGQALLDFVRSHVTNEATRIIAEVTEGLKVQGPPPLTPARIESITLRASPEGGHDGHERQSLLIDVNPPHAMVQCVWEAWGGVQLFPGNRSAYLNRTPSRGDGVRVDCFGILPYSTGRQFDELEWR